MMKKRSERLKHCALAVKAEPKILPRRRPHPGGAVWPKFNKLEMVTTFTYRPSLVKIDARDFELSRHQTHKATNTQRPPARCTQTGPRTIHCAAELSAQSN